MNATHLQDMKCVTGLILIKCILETVDLECQVQHLPKAGFPGFDSVGGILFCIHGVSM